MLVVGEIAAPERPYEVRSRPPRGRAWLSDDMVSNTNRVSTFGKRTPIHAIPCLPGSRTPGCTRGGDQRNWLFSTAISDMKPAFSRRLHVRWATWTIPSLRSGACGEQVGLVITGTYVITFECITGNAGSDPRDVKAGSPPML